jgi:NAD(P)-dependent dehydrogenase (short-subunit alcohol dehydrogenase family)
MHGGSAVDASAAPPSSAAVDCLPADKKMTQQQQAPPASSDDNDSSNTDTNSRRRLEGKVAIVTGGARGIGEAIARLFVAHGARVVIADVVDDAAGRAVASSLGPPEWCSYERCDVSVEADVERAVRRAVARHGRLDVLCNNAGVLGRQARGCSSILTLDAAEFERVVRVNALGIKHAARAMIAAGASCRWRA